MSFSVDLWEGFATIKNQFSLIIGKMKSFGKLCSEYVLLEKEHSQKLEDFFTKNRDVFPKVKTDFFIDRSLIKFLGNIRHQSEKIKNFCNSLNTDVIKQLNDFINKSSQIFLHNKYIDNSENDEKYEKSINNLLLKHEIFFSSCKDLYKCKSKSEINKVIKDKNIGKKIFKKDLAAEEKKSIQKMEKSKEDYISSLYEANLEREKYIENTEWFLENLENDYTNLIKIFQRCLNNYAVYKNRYLQEQFELGKKDYKENFAKIDVKKEVYNFILKNATKKFPMIKIEDNPIKLEFFDKTKLTSRFSDIIPDNEFKDLFKRVDEYFIQNKILLIDNDQTYKTKCKTRLFHSDSFRSKKRPFLGGVFNNNNPVPQDHNIENEYFNNINEDFFQNNQIEKNIAFIKEFTGKLLTSIDKNNNNNIKTNENSDFFQNVLKDEMQFMKLIDPKNKDKGIYLETFIKALSYNRSRGKFLLQGDSYIYLNMIFSCLLEKYSSNDYLLKNLLILSETFYEIDPCNENDKIYLLNGMKRHIIFTSPKIWHRVINYSFALSFKNRDIFNKMSEKERADKLNSIAFETVVSYLCTIKLISSNILIFSEVRNFYISVYNLDKEKVDKFIDEYLSELEKEKALKEKNARIEQTPKIGNLKDSKATKENMENAGKDNITNNNIKMNEEENLLERVKDINSAIIREGSRCLTKDNITFENKNNDNIKLFNANNENFIATDKYKEKENENEKIFLWEEETDNNEYIVIRSEKLEESDILVNQSTIDHLKKENRYRPVFRNKDEKTFKSSKTAGSNINSKIKNENDEFGGNNPKGNNTFINMENSSFENNKKDDKIEQNNDNNSINNTDNNLDKIVIKESQQEESNINLNYENNGNISNNELKEENVNYYLGNNDTRVINENKELYNDSNYLYLKKEINTVNFTNELNKEKLLDETETKYIQDNQETKSEINNDGKEKEENSLK